MKKMKRPSGVTVCELIVVLYLIIGYTDEENKQTSGVRVSELIEY